jgi:hypothetical protein
MVMYSESEINLQVDLNDSMPKAGVFPDPKHRGPLNMIRQLAENTQRERSEHSTPRVARGTQRAKGAINSPRSAGQRFKVQARLKVSQFHSSTMQP